MAAVPDVEVRDLVDAVARMSMTSFDCRKAGLSDGSVGCVSGQSGDLSEISWSPESAADSMRELYFVASFAACLLSFDEGVDDSSDVFVCQAIPELPVLHFGKDVRFGSKVLRQPRSSCK